MHNLYISVSFKYKNNLLVKMKFFYVNYFIGIKSLVHYEVPTIKSAGDEHSQQRLINVIEVY